MEIRQAVNFSMAVITGILALRVPDDRSPWPCIICALICGMNVFLGLIGG